jgi:hypothetical protein
MSPTAFHDSGYTRRELWRGAVLGTIAHAVSLLNYPELASEQSWDGPNYNVQNTMGCLGTVTFESALVTAAFFDPRSKMAETIDMETYEAERFFESAGSGVLSLAKRETFQYLLQKLNDIPEPVITSAFWTINDRIVAAKPWSEVLRDGAHLVEIQLLPPDAAISAWSETLSLSDDEANLVKRLFEEREHSEAVRIGADSLPRADYPASALEACAAILRQVGVALE